MTDEQEPITFEDVTGSFLHNAVSRGTHRYRNHLDPEDIRQELLVWIYGTGYDRIQRWLSASPQQLFRLARALDDEVVRFGEKEKAQSCGYETSDVQWYSPSLIEGLMPLALDGTFDGQGNSADGGKSMKPLSERGDLVAMVMDIRRALSRCPEWVESVFRHDEPGCAGYDDAIQLVLNYLGGARSGPGSRRAVSNAHAQVMTRNQEAS